MNGISIIICCYNSSERISATLQHLQNQKLESPVSWEVIVVDNASTDNTAEMVTRVWEAKPVTGLQIVYEKTPGLMHARQCGIRSAQFDILSFIDDDNWVEEQWVQKIAAVFLSNEKIGACGGHISAAFDTAVPGWFPAFQHGYAVGRQSDKSGFVDEEKGYLWGAGLSFRRSLWDELERRGFKNLTIGREGANINAGEDSELCYAFRLLGYKLYYRDDLTLQHFIPAARLQFSYLLKMNTGFGKANVRLNCYRVLLAPGIFRIYAWWYEWLVARKSILLESFLSIFSRQQDNRRKARVRRAYWKGYATQILSDRSRLKKFIANLQSVFHESESF